MPKHNEFQRNFAVIIGINNYQNGIRDLKTAVPDALKLAQIIQKQHETLKPYYQKQNRYEVQLFLNQRASLNQLKQLIADFKQGQISLDNEKVTVTKDDRLLFYFAGHGIALDALENQEGPVGYLIPQDAISGNSNTYLPMQDLHDALNALPCRHMLAILDCCFAGAFRWASLQREIVPKVKVYKERYDRFISDRAWQVITSASDTQKALDSLGVRGGVKEGSEVYSPFAKALFDALQGSADESADLNKDNIITATELYLYLRDRIEILTEKHYQRQTPSLCPLRKHDKGEFIFLLPDFDRNNLEDAPPLNAENNPYRGLQSYNEEHSHLFFGRENLIDKLYQKVVDNNQALTLVLGASGTGKSSLMKAGLLKRLRDSQEPKFEILAPMRPGETPLKALTKACFPISTTMTASELEESEQSLVKIIEHWSQDNPKTKVLLAVDQLEELITLCKSDRERKHFQQSIKNAIAKYPDKIHVVITLRLDFEGQFQNSVLKDFWNDDTRFVVPPMTQDEFREAIEKPALEKVLYFEPPSLVDELINEVVQMPGALPLLSFTLSELYLKYSGDQTRNNRALTKKDYEELGRVVGSITKRANEEYDRLIKDPTYKNTIRRVMLRMISLRGGELARRQVPKSELDYPDEEENNRVQTIIKSFSQARLIVEGSNSQGEPYVEPAHDALVRGWDKLLAWKKEEEENLILQRRLTPDAQEWKKVKSKEQLSDFQAKAEPIIDWLDSRLYTVENLLNKIPAQIASLWRQIQNRSIRFWQIYLLMWAVESRSYSLMRYFSFKVGCSHRQNQQERSREKPVQFLWNANPYLDVLNQQLQSNDNWLNKVEDEFVQQSVLQKRRNISWRWRIAIGVILGLSGLTITALIGQRDALIGQIRTSRQASEANLSFNELNALIDSLQAAKTLQDWPGYLPKPDPQLEAQVVQTLRKVFYVVKEQNRWEMPSGFKKMFLSDDKLLVIAEEEDGNLSLKDYLSENPEKPLTTFEERHKDLFEVAFSHDGRTIATADKNGTVRLWSIEGKKLATFQGYQSSSDRDIYRIEINFSPDSQQMSILFHDGNSQLCSVGLWDLSGNKPRELKTQSGSFLGSGFHSNGRLVVSKAVGTNLTLSYFLSGKYLKVFKDYMGDSWTDLLVSNNGEKLLALYNAAGGDANSANLTSLNSENMIQSWHNYDIFPEADIGTASFSPDGQQMAIARGLAYSRDREEDDNVIYLFESDDTSLKSPVELKGHQSYISQVTFSPNGKQLASVGSDIRLWDIKDKPIEQLGLKKGIPDISSMSLSPDGRQLAVVKNDGTISLLDLNGKELKSFSDLQGQVSEVTFSPDGQQLAVVKNDGTVSLLNLNGKELKSFSDLQGQASEVTFSPDGQQLAVLENDETQNKAYISSFNVKTREKKLDLEENYYGHYRHIGFSPQGDLIEAEDSVTGLFVLGSQSNNKILSSFTTGHGTLESLAFSPDGSLLASASDYDNNTIRVWNLSGKQLFAWEGDGKFQVKSMSFSGDGNLLATLGEDGTTKIWRIGGLNELLERGCQRVRNHLKNNPNVNPIDRKLCDGIPEPEQVAPPVSIAASPHLTPQDFLPTAQAIAEDYYTRGREQADEQLIANYTLVIENPDSDNANKADAYINRGVIHFRQKEYNLAINDYTEAIALAPQHIHAYINRGIAYSTQKDHERAIKDYNQAIAIAPDNADAYINRGIAYSSLGNHERAIKDYNQAIAIAPDNADAYYARGFTLALQEERKQSAIEAYQKAEELYQQQGKTDYSQSARNKIEELQAQLAP